MPLLPLPFLTALFLAFVLLRLVQSENRGFPALVLVTIGCYALQSVLLGVSWGIVRLPPLLLANLAFVLPPLTWLSLRLLTGRHDRRIAAWTIALVAALAAVANGIALQAYPVALDAFGILVYAGFGAMLIWTACRADPAWLDARPLHLMMPTRRAYFVAGAVLVASASVDILVTIDLSRNAGRMSPALVGYANLALLLIVIAVFFLRTAPPRPGLAAVDDPQRPPADPAHHDILARMDRAMQETHLYRDENLSLSRLARQVGVPARQISSAVNSLRAMNVPQYVNTFRIQDACRLLEQTDTPVTEIVFAAGFTTKSNFNREFQRITGVSPSAWRSRARGGQSVQ